MPQFLSPIGNDQFIDANGDPLTGGQVETYLNGSSTPAATYTSSSGATPQSNPIILNSLGYAPSPVWLTGGIAYKFVIKDASGVTLRTIDDISGINDASVSQSEWVESGLVPTYINATSFSVPGDQTPILQINRRLRTTNTSGLVYSSISNSVFAAGITTVTLTNDSTTLDAGLSLIAYGLLSADDPSAPLVQTDGIANAAVTLAKIQDIATAQILGRSTAGTGDVEQLTGTQVTALLSLGTESAKGVVEKLTIAEASAGVDDTRYHSAATMKAAQIQLGTAVTLTTQTAVDFTAIPSWVKRVVVSVLGSSTNGTSIPLIQLGTSGGVESTGYSSNTGNVSAGTNGSSRFTNGFALYNVAITSAITISGSIVLQRVSGNTWTASSCLHRDDANVNIWIAGSKALPDALTQIRLTTVAGVDQFDAGSVNISYE